MSAVIETFRATFVLLVVLSILLGGAYPLAVMAVSQLIFHDAAQGSLLMRDEKVVGSRLLGQSFTSAKYFWGRPSATVPPYNPEASAGSNLPVGASQQLDLIGARINAWRKAHPNSKERLPMDVITASGSGLDPHISLEAAMQQLSRVAKARAMKEEALAALVREHVEPALLLGDAQRYVNVVSLNVALDTKSAAKEKR